MDSPRTPRLTPRARAASRGTPQPPEPDHAPTMEFRATGQAVVASTRVTQMLGAEQAGATMKLSNMLAAEVCFSESDAPLAANILLTGPELQKVVLTESHYPFSWDSECL
jgi:hypothetical protein